MKEGVRSFDIVEKKWGGTLAGRAKQSVNAGQWAARRGLMSAKGLEEHWKEADTREDWPAVLSWALKNWV